MRLPAFKIENQRSIVLAECENVPALMVIAGPNGSGKSTLLNAIRSLGGKKNIMYVGPHRSMRRQVVRSRDLLAPPISFESILSAQQIPGFEGVRMSDSTRDPWGHDDSANFLKHALCQIEVERQAAITARVDRDGGIEQGTVVDPWKPLRELTTNLLPHMSFAKIDSGNRDGVRVLWNVHGRDSLVDLDDLSSGEKSIIQMFYPLVEREIKTLLQEIKINTDAPDTENFCVLIDEPELHLHPNLQNKVLDYLRILTIGTNMQVIVTTHSPTMVEYASFEELFLLKPVELVGFGENQLVQVASNEEHLTFLRSVFGDTANLTALQPVVVVEGVGEKTASKVLPDRKLYRALHPGFDGVTLIPGGGKSECRALLRALTTALAHFSHQLQAVALLDRDTDEGEAQPGIELLPVSMIENFLLDPDSIWEAIQSVAEKTTFSAIGDVSDALDKTIARLTESEIERRTAQALGSSHFFPPSAIEELTERSAKYIAEVTLRYAPDAIAAAALGAKDKVETLRGSDRRREHFHGKNVLQDFYREHLHRAGLPKNVFAFEAARHARSRQSVADFFDDFFARLATAKTSLD